MGRSPRKTRDNKVSGGHTQQGGIYVRSCSERLCVPDLFGSERC